MEHSRLTSTFAGRGWKYFINLWFVCQVLPYYGDIDDWRYLYLQLNKESRFMYEKNELLFKRLDRKIYHNPFLDNDSSLKLVMHSIRASDKQRLNNILQSKFRRVKRMTIIFECGTIGIEEGLKLNKFLRVGLPLSIKFMYIRGSSSFISLDRIRDGLYDILPRIQEKATFVNFTLTQMDIKMIFEQTVNLKEISFFSCRVDDISDSLEFDIFNKHKLRSIDFHNTWEYNNPK